jgi:hypothetical protein
MLSGDDDGWAWLKDKARQQGAQPPGAGGAALKPLGAPPPLPGKSAPRAALAPARVRLLWVLCTPERHL